MKAKIQNGERYQGPAEHRLPKLDRVKRGPAAWQANKQGTDKSRDRDGATSTASTSGTAAAAAAIAAAAASPTTAATKWSEQERRAGCEARHGSGCGYPVESKNQWRYHAVVIVSMLSPQGANVACAVPGDRHSCVPRLTLSQEWIMAGRADGCGTVRNDNKISLYYIKIIAF